MSNKEKVIKIITNLYIQTNSSILKKMIKDIESDSLLTNRFVYLRKNVLWNFYKRHPELKISLEDIEYVINYLESIEIMQKLI